MRRIATFIGISSVVVGLAGVSTAAVQAATASSHYSACASASGTLSLEVHGKCAKHTSKVTLDAAGPRGVQGIPGPRGPAGPGAVTTSFSQPITFSPNAGPSVATGISGVTVVPLCDGAYARVDIDGDGNYTVQGDLAVSEGSGGVAQLDITGGAGQNLVEGGNAAYVQGAVSGGNQIAIAAAVGNGTNTTDLDGGIAVTVGSSTFELQVAESSTSTTCAVTAVVTPTTTAPTG